MAITKEQVCAIAQLARMDLDAATLAHVTSQLDGILAYMEQLNAVDTADTPPLSHAVRLENVFRRDERRPSLTNEQALQNAPEQSNGNFKVPKAI